MVQGQFKNPYIGFNITLQQGAHYALKYSNYSGFAETVLKSIFGSSSGYAQANISFSYKHKVTGAAEHSGLLETVTHISPKPNLVSHERTVKQRSTNTNCARRFSSRT